MHSATLNMNVLDHPYRAMTVGALALVSVLAFEAMAVTAAMPVVAQALDGLAYFPLAFGGAMASSMVGMVMAGSQADRSGPATPLWIGIIWFVLGLGIAGAADHMLIMVLGRTVMGLGVGMQSVALYACIGKAYPAHLHARIFGLFAAAWIVPALVGPLLAGVIVESVGWRWVFWMAPMIVLPSALLLAPGLRALPPPEAPPGAPLTDDRRRLALALGAAVSATLVHHFSQEHSLLAWTLAGVALLSMGALGARLLPAGVLTMRRGLPAVIALRGLVAAAFATTEIYIPLLLNQQRGFSTAEAGVVLSTGALSWSIGSWWQGRLPAEVERGPLISRGMAIMACGILLVALMVLPEVPVAAGVLGLILTGLGIGMTFPQLSVLTLRLAPAERQGTSVSALQLCDALTTTAAVAIGGALFTLLLTLAPSKAYLANFGLALAMAVVGVWGGQRVRPALG